LIGKHEFPLSFRLIGSLGKLEDDERVAVLGAEAQASDAESARATLNELLKAATRSRANVELGDMDCVRRYTAAIEDWFADFRGEMELTFDFSWTSPLFTIARG